ncbi:biotin/lipoyl-binding protein, partial [Actinomycetospora atypica]
MATGGSRRLWIVNGLVLLAVLLAAGGTTYALTSSSSTENTALRTTPLGRGTVAETVTASGTVTSSTSATLNFSASGKIAEVRVRLGDRVTKGQVVAVLDGEYARANLDAADAQVSAAEQQVDDARYAKDNPPSTAQQAAPAAQAPAAQAPAGQAPAGQAPAAAPAAPAPAAPAAPAAGQKPPQTQPQQQQPQQQQPRQSPRQQREAEIMGNFAGSSRGVEAVGPVAAQQQPSPTPAPGAGASSGGAAGGATAQTSEDPGEAGVRSAESTLATARANRIQAFQATENLDLVAPQDGTVVSLDGVAGQIAGPQGIVVSSTATGNPAGGRLPDGSAISSGAGSGPSASRRAAGSAAAVAAA